LIGLAIENIGLAIACTFLALTVIRLQRRR
jgi:hypothetical protein